MICTPDIVLNKHKTGVGFTKSIIRLRNVFYCLTWVYRDKDLFWHLSSSSNNAFGYSRSTSMVEPLKAAKTPNPPSIFE